MWEALRGSPRGRISTRFFVMLFATLLVVSLGVSLSVSETVYAADASWQGNKLLYGGNSYTGPIDTTDATGLNIPREAQVYQFIQGQGNNQTANIIYFAPGAVPKSAKEATYITYTLNPPNTYSNPSSATDITLDDSGTEPPTGTSEGTSSCQVENIGWLVCGIGGFISNGVDKMYEIIASFLEVQPITGGNNSIYRLWDVVRDFANATFLIAFLVIIYRYLSASVVDNYTVRKIVPRLVIAAILINVSYWICAVAVDISNILGASLQEIFITIRESAVGTEVNTEISWTELTTAIMSGGTIGALGFYAATGGSLTSFAFIILGVLITVAFAALVALIVLAARQALIILFIAISPLAFAANVLPNTEDWFTKWRKAFVTLLLVFPIFSMIFGGSQLASAAIIQNADNIAVMILGMAVKVVPLVITPLLIQFSGSLVGRIAGMVNNKGRGIFDRAKGWSNDQADHHKMRALSGDSDKFRPYHKPGQWMNRRKMAQEDKKKNYEEMAKNRYHDTKRYGGIDQTRREIEQEHKRLEAEHDLHWKQRLDIQDGHFDASVFDKEVESRKLVDQGKRAEERMEMAYAEMKAGNDPYEALGKGSRVSQAQINEIQATARDITVDGLRKAQAEKVQSDLVAKELKADIDLRKYAGGIAGEAGAARVFAKAKSDVTQAYLDDVKAQRSVLEDHTVKQLINLAHDGKRKDGTAATEAEIDAAIQEIVLTKGNNWSFQKLKDHIATVGVKYDEESGTYYEQDGKTPISYEEAESRRTRQQIFVDAAKNSKLKIANLSGTDRGNLEAGLFTMESGGKDGSIVRDVRDQKINANRLAGTDIDELMRMVQVLRDDDARQAMTTESREALVKTIEFALTDPQVSASIGTREANMMRVMSSYLEDSRSSIPLTDKVRYEAATETPIPTAYEPDRFYDVPAKYKQGGEPYGPDASTTYRGAAPSSEDSGN